MFLQVKHFMIKIGNASMGYFHRVELSSRFINRMNFNDLLRFIEKYNTL